MDRERLNHTNSCHLFGRLPLKPIILEVQGTKKEDKNPIQSVFSITVLPEFPKKVMSEQQTLRHYLYQWENSCLML